MKGYRGRRRAPRRRGVIVLIVVVVCALLVAALLVARSAGRSSGGPADRAGTAVVVEIPPPSAMSATATGPAREPVGWPADLRWTAVAGLPLPVSATVGPRDLSGGRARGFAIGQAGAMLAVVHLVVRTSPQVGPAVFGPTLREQVVGPDAASYAEAVHGDYEAQREQLLLPPGEPLGRIYGSITGLRVDSYSDDAASLRLLIEAPGRDGGIERAATVVQVAWSGGDWKLVAPPQGDWSTVRAPVPADRVGDYPPIPGR
ncbi:hypothetical protein O7627_27520 [Solwaraspora sp. WMMD1047]|uniref:hypothetical protein n=1 Tax=Solwaraspora sp. WMMD1047 TaxID=3016102 RepID=UPI002417A1AB|nr:hypothetical protein [Solwaraspora sp. WMMD1047]MDG4833027.1 hypothetical protein [Solwaraspora sp. WMMD1047]